LLERRDGAVLAAVARDAIDLHVGEADALEDRLVLRLDERAADARAPRVAVGASLGPRLVGERGIEDGETSTGPQRAERLDQRSALVVDEVDHTVRDHDVDRATGDREVLEIAREDRYVRETLFGRRFARPLDHLRCEVDADSASRRTDLTRGLEEVASRTGTEVENGFAGLQLRDLDGITEAERGRNLGLRQLHRVTCVTIAYGFFHLSTSSTVASSDIACVFAR
jgi:hypothetical protein